MKARRDDTIRRAVGALALVAACSGWWIDRPMFFAAWLAAWWFCLGLVLGAAANARIHALTGGRWGDALVPASRALQRTLPWLLLLFVPLLAGLPVIYPWAAANDRGLGAMAHPAFAAAWFDARFFGLRLLCYAAGFWLLGRRATRAGGAAVGLVAYMLLMSFAAVDLVMALLPAWKSTVFGWLAISAQMTAGAAAATALAAFGNRRDESAHPVWRDLGNLLLMYLLLQAYLQFMQFLIIWSENLPREIAWYLPRLATGWAAVSLALVLLQLVVPVLALLWRRNKDDPRRLAWIAGGVVAVQALGAAWLVVPSVEATGYAAWWLLPLMFAGMGLLLFGRVPERLRPEAAHV